MVYKLISKIPPPPECGSAHNPNTLTYACSLVLWDGTMGEQSDPAVEGWTSLEPMSPSVTIPRMLFDLQFAVWAHGFFRDVVWPCGHQTPVSAALFSAE